MVFAVLGHLIGTAFKAFWRILITAVVCAVLGMAAVLLAIEHYTQRLQWPPRDEASLVALIGVGALAAYAGGATALMTEAVRALKEAARLVEKEAIAPVQAVGRELEGAKH